MIIIFLKLINFFASSQTSLSESNNRALAVLFTNVTHHWHLWRLVLFEIDVMLCNCVSQSSAAVLLDRKQAEQVRIMKHVVI